MHIEGDVMKSQEELDYERNVNREYQKSLLERNEKNKEREREINVQNRSLWNSGFKFTNTGNLSELIAGRVSLETESDGLPANFYIGPVFIENDDLFVISFAAPVASLFYDGKNSGDEASSLLDGRRTFVANGNDLIDYSDDIEAGKSSSDVFPRTSKVAPTLEIPKAPTKAPKPKIERPQPVVRDTDSESQKRLESLRGKEAVIAALEAPKTGELGSLLGTLQADQYRIVSRDHRLPIIVQGNPGAGKTVVALHRAAYLTHPAHNENERPGQNLPLSQVGVIGPTSDYVNHVLNTPGRIGGARISVMSIDGLLANLAGGSAGDSFEGIESHESSISTSEEFATALEFVVQKFKEDWPGEWNLEKLVGLLVGDNEDAEEYFVEANPTEGARFADYLRQFSSFSDARRHRQNSGWLAVVGIALGAAHQFNFDHLIVDEAQDLSPLMWHVLRSVLRPGGGMSIFGDINQRRNDLSWESWEQVATSVPLGQLANDEGLSAPELEVRKNFEIVELSVGYRSTIEIQTFANKVLPAKERSVTALRHGESPKVLKTKRSELVSTVVDEVEAMVNQFPSGISAVIGPDADHIQRIGDALRGKGWRTKPGTRERELEGMRIALLLPDQARGLEFDGVVVVEPNQFPQHEGGMRVLYTSLTRANQLLEVVYAQSLPSQLLR